MFYKPQDENDQPHFPLNTLVIPRPIGWISTLDRNGVPNLAPYSFFNAVAYYPPQVMFAATSGHAYGGKKDSVRNAVDTGEFVVNIATSKLRQHMNVTAVPAPPEVDEFEHAGLEKADSRIVRPHRVAESPVHLECRTIKSLELPSEDKENLNTVVFGQVMGFHIDDHYIVDGKLDVARLVPIGRLGYLDYVEVNNTFSMERPKWND